jgi:uncharacterized lipoprotein YddW (UPF0748 family)
VVSNEDFVECSGFIDLPQGIWSRIAATWKDGPAGFCKIFVDDSLIGSTVGRLSEKLLSLDRLYIGSDEGTTEHFGRTANAQIRNLQISATPVTHRQIIQTYLAEEDARQRDLKHWGWLRTARTSNAATPVDFSTFSGVRALFDEDIAWAASPESVEKRLLSVKNAGFNTYIPCIWHGRGSVYPSQLVFSDERLAHAHSVGWDPLEYLVRRAHQMNISVHVWVNVARRETDAFPQWHGIGVPNDAYDVHDEAFRTFVVDMMIDVVRRYDVDGVNLDYIRAMGICVSPSCAQDYFRKNKHELLSDRAAASQGGDARLRIQKWQDEAVGDIVSRFSITAHQIRSSLRISVDTHLSRPEFRELEGRDDFEWLRQGWLDMVFHMDYRTAIDVAQIDWARTQVGDARKLALLFANYDVIDEDALPRDGAWVASVVEYAQKQWPGVGIGIYLYNYMNADQQNALGDLIGGRSFGIANRQRVK